VETASMSKVAIRVTVDTNVLNAEGISRLEGAALGLPIELVQTSVSEREQETYSFKPPTPTVMESAVWGESRWGQAVWGGTVLEPLVLDESRLDQCVLGSDDDAALFETLLRIIGAGSFPKLGDRDWMSKGARNQMRDAMIFTTHVREGRDIFVTNDKKAFIGRDGNIRRQLEAMCGTRIMTLDEFCAYCDQLHDARATRN
jgi:hypothetical protein